MPHANANAYDDPIVRRALHALRVYRTRTGLSLGALAASMGYARISLIMFSGGTYGREGSNSSARTLAETLLRYIAAHPIALPASPGKLYPTANTRLLDQRLDQARDGAWCLIYGPPGTQKTFLFESRVAEDAARAGSMEERDLIYVYASESMAPSALLRELARGFGALANGAPGERYQLTSNILLAISERKRKPVLIIDEAHHLGGNRATLEILREICDRGRIGVVVAGHDDLEDIFLVRRPGSKVSQLEQWVSRIDYRDRLPGLSTDDVRTIVRGELGAVADAVVSTCIGACEVEDKVTGRKYRSVRRLMKALRQVRK
jgi:type II secretory pathway predicted ATPase ExeA